MMHFAADIALGAEAIAGLAERVAEFLRSRDIDLRTAHHVSLVVEELLLNAADHGGAAASDARVVVEIAPDRVHVTVADRGRPFDPRGGPTADVTLAAEERTVGGLGLHLVRQLTADLDYRRDADQNWTSFCIMRRP
jgi:anti-sigma regulatory factor (Ser/Thr protein kinase)